MNIISLVYRLNKHCRFSVLKENHLARQLGIRLPAREWNSFFFFRIYFVL